MSNNTPLGTVALCLSGGGYRAAAFHLGTIDMLNELGLLDNVKLLSTVSGGTFTGMSYAMWRADQPNLAKFDEFYKEFYCFTADNNIIAEALKLLTKERKNNSPKEVSLIRAAAEIYHREVPYSKGKTFGELYDSAGKLKAPFDDLIFNSTEFLRGNSFRFRASRNKKAVIGNKFFKIDLQSAKHLRLADIAAASSCFPAGFEPLLFPDEFDWKKENSVRLTADYLKELAAYYFESDRYYKDFPKNPTAPIPVRPANSGTQTTIAGREIILENYIRQLDNYYQNLAVHYRNIANNIPNKFDLPTKPKNAFINENLTLKCDEDGKPVTIPLMDGGIYDNQGIASIILADNAVGSDIDLFIISDTNQRDDEMLQLQPKFNLAAMLKLPETSSVAKFSEQQLAKAASGIWNKVAWLALAVGGISLIYAVSLLYKIFIFVSNNAFSWANAAWMIFFYFFPFMVMILLIGAVFGIFNAKLKFNKFLDKHREIKIKDSKFKLLKFAEKITLNDVGNLVSTRLTSLVTMSANVFMKAIRDEQYKHINQHDVINLSSKELPRTVKTLGRIAYNLIYDLNPTDKQTQLWNADIDLIPTRKMVKISRDAEAVGTTLWFDKDSGELKNLVICGQITVCLSIMKFLIEHRGTIPNDPNSPYHALYMQVKERWMKLKQNPEAYYRNVNCSKSE